MPQLLYPTGWNEFRACHRPGVAEARILGAFDQLARPQRG